LPTNPTTLFRIACVTLSSAALTASIGAFSAVPASADSGTVTVTPPASTVIPPEPAARPVAGATPYTNEILVALMAEASASMKVTKSALQQAKAKRAIEVATNHLGDPYVWGATGPGAFDCSGLVQFAWRKAGVTLPRTTWSMLSAVKKKVSLAHLKPGDLIFTDGGGHMGMYIGHDKVIAAPHTGAVVRIDSLNGYWSSSFVAAVRPDA
jgi:murein DD-endopeptidase